MTRNNARIINGSATAPVSATPVRFWNIANTDGDSAELTLYGEIVSRRPMDWWTGEPLDGLFVSPEEFLSDLTAIRGKSNITIRINSIGGDLYTALGIYTQLKELTGKKTVVIDGIAASAATIIAMAGDTIKMPAGGLFMIHEALLELRGVYNRKKILDVVKHLEAANRAAAETYAAKTKLGMDTIRELMAEETWMTGNEAVEKGFADELIFDNEPQMLMSTDYSILCVNGINQDIKGFHNVPGNIPVMKTEIIKPQGGKPQVKTLEELRGAYPDLVAQIENSARESGKQEGVLTERSRIKAIEDIQSAIGDTGLLSEAKYGEKPCTAEELAFVALKKQASLGVQHLGNVEKDYAASGASQVTAAPNGGNSGGSADDASEISAIVGIYNKLHSGGAKQ